ncbi:hypothetical protein INR49_007053 [Caranx melampygus]|nr:hypothetical protein INR49_007053 [Caranx melampygus]
MSSKKRVPAPDSAQQQQQQQQQGSQVHLHRFCSSAADSASSIIRSHHKPLSEASYSSHATPRTGKHQLTGHWPLLDPPPPEPPQVGALVLCCCVMRKTRLRTESRCEHRNRFNMLNLDFNLLILSHHFYFHDSSDFLLILFFDQFRSPPESSTFWLSCPWSCCSFRWRLQCFAESWRRRRSASGRQHTLFSLGGNYSTHNPSAAAQPVALPGARPVEPWETRSSSDSCEQ